MTSKLVVMLTVLISALSLKAYAQNISEGEVLAFDRKANVLIFTDKTVWPLSKLTSPVPDNLKAGDRVEIFYASNEDDGVTEISKIKILSE